MKHAGQNLSPAVEIVKVVSVDPVKDVEEAVEAESSDVVRGDVFDEADLVEHHYLRDECDGLKPETEAPHEFPGRPS